MTRLPDETRDGRRLSREELDDLAERIVEEQQRDEDSIRRAFAEMPFVEETAEEMPDPDELKP